MNRRLYNDSGEAVDLLDPEIKKYIRLTLNSGPNILRSYLTSEYDWFSHEIQSVEAESC